MPTPPVPPRIHRPTDRAGARAAGVTDWQLRHLEVVRSSRHTYLPAAMVDDVHARVAAVLLAAPPSAVISHLTAASLWGIQVPLVAEDRRVHLTVPPSTRIRSRSDRRVHCADLEGWQIARRDGVPLTSPGRTWRDLAGELPAAALLAVTDQMLARRYPPEAFRRLVDEGRGMRGIRNRPAGPRHRESAGRLTDGVGPSLDDPRGGAAGAGAPAPRPWTSPGGHRPRRPGLAGAWGAGRVRRRRPPREARVRQRPA